MNSPKVPALVALRMGLTAELAHCADCEDARESSLATDAVCMDHYVLLHKELTRPSRSDHRSR